MNAIGVMSIFGMDLVEDTFEDFCSSWHKHSFSSGYGQLFSAPC